MPLDDDPAAVVPKTARSAAAAHSPLEGKAFERLLDDNIIFCGLCVGINMAGAKEVTPPLHA